LDFVSRDLYSALHLLIRRSQGDWSDDTYPREFPSFQGKGDISLTPWSLFERWVAERKPAPSTVDRWRGVFLRMENDFGDRSATSITPEEAQDWCRGLINEKPSAATANEVWKSAARTVFGWAVGQRLLPRNPFEDIKITVPKKVRTREDGRAFSPEEMKIILRAASAITQPESNNTNAVRRWVPWLLAYTGARSGEITQLRRQDVIEREGVPAIRITPDAGNVKGGQPRTVPLHEHLIEQGFLKFVEANEPGPLFYNEDKAPKAPDDPTNPRKPRHVKAREHLAVWVRKLGVTDREIQPLHAWRHTFKQIGHRDEISDRLLDAICGHASPTERK
jgi:integrase